MSGESKAARASKRAANPQYVALRRYERRWLPALSAANLFGITMFFVYVGSALYSAVRPSCGSCGASAAFTRAQEVATCKALLAPPSSICLGRASNATGAPRRTIYMQPYGALGSRLRGVASGLTLGREVDADVVIVWQDAEYGFTGAWADLFAEPKLPLGCFPGHALRPETAKCTVHTVNHESEWAAVQEAWETVVGEDGVPRQVLCLKSVMYLTPKQRDIGWMYRLLEPAHSIRARVDAFMAAHDWAFPATAWVGVHARRTDLMLKCTSEHCVDGVAVQEALPLSRFTDVMKAVAELAPPGVSPRFFLATDDPEAEAAMREELLTWAGAGAGRYSIAQTGILPGNSSDPATPSTGLVLPPLDPTLGVQLASGGPVVVSLPKATRDTSGGWLEMRSVVSGVQEAVADLYLLR